MATTSGSVHGPVDRIRARQDWLGEFGQDVRFALRQARSQPGFTLATILTLALGLGATTAIFSVVHAVVLAPFPFPDPARVLAVQASWQGRPGSTSVGNFEYIRRQATLLDPLAASVTRSYNLSGSDQPERVTGVRATWTYFQAFGVAPQLGRTFTSDEDRPGQGRVAVISHGLWQRRFGGDRAVLGGEILLDGESYRIIGVMPSTFAVVGGEAAVWFPLAFTTQQLGEFDGHFLTLTGRRRADVTLAQVNDELGRIAEGLERDHPQFNLARGLTAQRFDERTVGDYRLRLTVLLAAVTLVLVIACGNVANLLLARLAARSRELAVRAALGAGRGRIIRQVLAESLVLAAIGGLGGVLAARWMLPVLVAAAPAGVPRLDEAAVNGTVLAVAAALAALSAIAVGVLPAWHATRGDLRDDLVDGRSTAGGSLKPWVRQTLLAAQAALVLVVLAGASLLIRSAINLQQVPIGFDTSGVLRARIGLPSSQYRSPAQVRAAYANLLERLEAAPGVALAALDSRAPLGSGIGTNGLLPEGRPAGPESVVISRTHFVTPGYFRVLRQPLLAGRAFEPSDVRTTPLVMIVNQSLANAAFPGEDPIGRRISCCEGTADEPVWKTIVGVVADVRSRGPAGEVGPEFYLPLAQIPDHAFSWVQNSMDIMVRPASGSPAALAGAIREAVHAVDPAVPVFALGTMADSLRDTTAEARFNMWLMTLLGMTGLALAALGIYSVLAWLVAQRTREIGVRLALGAPSGAVVRHMVRQGLAPVAVGLVAGLGLSVAAGRFLEGQLFQVSARDPITLAAAAALLLAVAAIASFLPAWRATGIDPVKALHDA